MRSTSNQAWVEEAWAALMGSVGAHPSLSLSNGALTGTTHVPESHQNNPDPCRSLLEITNTTGEALGLGLRGWNFGPYAVSA
jgi:hypothetical protein